MKTDRLRFLSIGVLAVAALALVGEISSHNSAQPGVVITLILLGTALEQVRLEIRDIREELLKRKDTPEVPSTRHI